MTSIVLHPCPLSSMTAEKKLDVRKLEGMDAHSPVLAALEYTDSVAAIPLEFAVFRLQNLFSTWITLLLDSLMDSTWFLFQ